jgi:hypothetical protein
MNAAPGVAMTSMNQLVVVLSGYQFFMLLDTTSPEHFTMARQRSSHSSQPVSRTNRGL